MTVAHLLEKINFPTDAKDGVLNILSAIDLKPYESVIELLLCESTCVDAGVALKEISKEINDHERVTLAILIEAAARSYQRYKTMGIPDDIYIDTMKVFTRYANAYKTRHGIWGFDRSHWVVRHVGMKLFRLGTLEYEYTVKRETDVIAIHIPPDAELTDEKLDETFIFAREFTKRYYPERNNRNIVTETWLITPKLDTLLAENSKILKFKRRFNIIDTSYGYEGALGFLFDQYPALSLKETDIGSLPEKTSLQRSVKEIYKKGEALGNAYGILKE